MIKLQVLRYMGILTIMKLSVFAMSALSLLIALTWVLLYCPVGLVKHPVSSNEPLNPPHSSKSQMKLSDYFSQYEAELEEDLTKMKPVEHKPMEKKLKTAENVVKIPKDLFNNEAFEEMIKQLNTKDIEGYEFLAESTNVSIYRQPKGNAGLYKYKLYATLPNATPDQITAVFLDSEYRLVWDTYVTGLYSVQSNEKGPDVIYFNVDYPWPLTNRDYVYAREPRKLIRDGTEYTVIVMHSITQHNVKEVKGAIRVTDYHQSLAMRKFQDRGTIAYIEYYDNPKGSIPSWLVNWAAKTGVPAFLKDLQRACAGLDKFLKEKNRPAISVSVQ